MNSQFKLQEFQGKTDFLVSGSYVIDQNKINVDYLIENQSSFPWQLNPDHSTCEHACWGLWETDVFEVFIATDDNNYWEYQVSPLNQMFCLKTLRPREIVATPLTGPFLAIENKVEEYQWAGRIQLICPDVKQIKWGNLHACLGTQKNRHYFSLNHIKSSHVDFHNPQQFVEL